MELDSGAQRLGSGPSRFGTAGIAARRASLRVTRPLAVRTSLLAEQIVSAVEAVAWESAVAHRGASGFPEPLDPATVVEAATDVGLLYLHADDEVMTPFISENGYWETAEVAFLRSVVRSDMTMLDVGANVGYFSVLGSTLVGLGGRVVAVEPEAGNLRLLKANLWRNACANVAVLPLAAHRATGFLPLRFNEKNRGDHQVGWQSQATSLVPCARLDDLVAGLAPDVIKIDTQGVDHDVIAGLSGVLDRGSVTIMCEFWVHGMDERGIDPAEIANSYRDQGFTLSLLDDNGVPAISSPAEVVAAARSAPGAYVNVVLS